MAMVVNMWTISVLLFCIRLYFALQPSYIHPDENFQGPEVIAGKQMTPLFQMLDI